MSVKKTGKAGTKKRPVAKQKTAKASSGRAKAAAGINRKAAGQIRALSSMGGEICDDSEKLNGVLNIIKDSSAPRAVRMAALQTLISASFSAANFDACRPEYLAALRSVVSDPDLEIRKRVLGILSRENDGYTQQVLLEGLRDSSKALLPPEKALQLLGNDIHAEAYPLARGIIQNPPNATARREALRLLSADAASAPVFETILRDKNEPVEIRQLSAAALNALAPQKLQQHAREIVLDASEGDQLKATSLTAITHLANAADVSKDDALYQGVHKLKTGAKSQALKRVSRQFLAKYVR